MWGGGGGWLVRIHMQSCLEEIDVVAALVTDDCCEDQAGVLKQLGSFKQQGLRLFPIHFATRENKNQMAASNNV